MRVYLPESPKLRFFRQKQEFQKLTEPAPVTMGREAPRHKNDLPQEQEVKRSVAKEPPRSNARAHRFLDQVEAVRTWWRADPGTNAVATSKPTTAPATASPRPYEPFDLQDVPAAREAAGYRLEPALMRQWFTNPAYTAASQEQEEGAPGAPFYPQLLVDSSRLKMVDLLKFDRIQQAVDKIKSKEFLESKPVRDALYKVCSKLPADTVDVEPMKEFGGDLQKMHRRYAFASVTVGQRFPKSMDDIRTQALDKSGGFADEVELALGEFKLYVAIQDAHVFYNGRTTRRVNIKELALYVMAPYGFDALEPGTPYIGHFSKTRFALVSDGDWVNAPVYSGKDPHAKHALLRPVARAHFVQWRQQHNKGGDMLLFSDRRPAFPNLDVVVPLAAGDPRFALLGRVAAGFMGRLVSPSKPSLHFTLVIYYPNGETFGIDGQPTTDVGELKYDTESPYAVAFGPVPVNMADALRNAKLIRSNFYKNSIPQGIVKKFEIQSPEGMDADEFAKNLIAHAQDFASYTINYSSPKKFGGSTMSDGEYNSSSYLAGLLKSVMGYIPLVDSPEYQTPGWDNPIPSAYFKGEAIK